MQDLKINVGGPRDHAQQHLSFNVHYSGKVSGGIEIEKIEPLLKQFRAEIEHQNFPAEDLKRVNRHLTTIEDESKANRPAMKDIENSLTSIGKIMASVQAIAPTAVAVFRTLAGALGFSV